MLLVDVLLEQALLGVGLCAEGTLDFHIPVYGVNVTIQRASL